MQSERGIEVYLPKYLSVGFARRPPDASQSCGRPPGTQTQPTRSMMAPVDPHSQTIAAATQTNATLTRRITGATLGLRPDEPPLGADMLAPIMNGRSPAGGA